MLDSSLAKHTLSQCPGESPPCGNPGEKKPQICRPGEKKAQICGPGENAKFCLTPVKFYAFPGEFL